MKSEKFLHEFDFLDNVWTIDDNKVQQGTIVGMAIRGNPKGYIEFIQYTISCKGTGSYLTKPQHLLFKTKEELLDSL